MTISRFLMITGVMALVTYLIRMLPMVLFRKQITSPYVKAFLMYVPYAVLSAMTLPDILYTTGNPWAGAAALIVAFVMSWKGKALLPVAVAACATALLVQGAMLFFGV